MQIIKQKRKTLSVKIGESGEIIVKAPLFCTKKQIHTFLEKHKIWIENQQEKILKHKKEFKIGEEFYFFGKKIPLIFTQFQSFKGDLDFLEGQFFINLQNPEEIKQAFIHFYKKEAKKYIVPRTYEIAKKLELSFNKIRITSAKTRWGSCSSKKNVNFSWRLAMVPKDIIDYVIIHELAHLTEMNHSKNFWSLVEKYYSILGKNEYLNDRNALKKYSLITKF